MKWTIHAASVDWQISEETLRNRLRAKGHEVRPRDKFTTLEINEVVFRQLEREKIRLVRADADVREMERAKMRSELVDSKAAEIALQRILVPLRARLLALPVIAAPLINPFEPEPVRQILQQEIERCLNERDDEDELDGEGITSASVASAPYLTS